MYLSESEYQCQWKGCIRQKKTVPPFPSIMRLARHAKEQHILKASGRVVAPAERSRSDLQSLYYILASLIFIVLRIIF
jgi:protein polybromo-1